MSFGLSTAAVVSIIGAATAVAGTTYGIVSSQAAKRAAKKLPTNARERIRQIEKQIASKEKSLFTATGDKANRLALDIQDLKDEKTILEMIAQEDGRIT